MAHESGPRRPALAGAQLLRPDARMVAKRRAKHDRLYSTSILTASMELPRQHLQGCILLTLPGLAELRSVTGRSVKKSDVGHEQRATQNAQLWNKKGLKPAFRTGSPDWSLVSAMPDPLPKNFQAFEKRLKHSAYVFPTVLKPLRARPCRTCPRLRPL